MLFAKDVAAASVALAMALIAATTILFFETGKPLSTSGASIQLLSGAGSSATEFRFPPRLPQYGDQ